MKVTNVEVREITPPPGVQEAMTRQMSAERTRRAVVTEAEGTKPAAVTVAEGEKQAAILHRRGRPPGGDPPRRGLRARAREDLRGRADRRREHDAAAVPRRAEADRHIGATKIVVPMDLAGLLSKVTGLAEESFRNDDGRKR